MISWHRLAGPEPVPMPMCVPVPMPVPMFMVVSVSVPALPTTPLQQDIPQCPHQAVGIHRTAGMYSRDSLQAPYPNSSHHPISPSHPCRESSHRDTCCVPQHCFIKVG